MASASVQRPLPHVADVRHFNRFYTKQIGVLQEGLLNSPFSLTEVRVLYELAHRSRPTASELSKELGLDPGYLSRTLRCFERQGLIRREASQSDARQSLLTLSAKGRKVFVPLEARSDEQVAEMLSKLTSAQRERLTEAMHVIEGVLGDGSTQEQPRQRSYVLRPPQSGDMGWVVHRHGALYMQEYGYDERFEALVAQIVAEFVQKFDPRVERCWIAERDGEIVGSVFVVRKSKTVSKLRLLLVEPSARGLGIGRRLVEECLRFARQVGYRKMMLWTQSELESARHLYEDAGFKLAGRQRHKSWGREDLVAETWVMEL
jgi:DNA-binding MarR family transcriptional regulator/GNAT superfamily N-acetyltransferase